MASTTVRREITSVADAILRLETNHKNNWDDLQSLRRMLVGIQQEVAQADGGGIPGATTTAPPAPTPTKTVAKKKRPLTAKQKKAMKANAQKMVLANKKRAAQARKEEAKRRREEALAAGV